LSLILILPYFPNISLLGTFNLGESKSEPIMKIFDTWPFLLNISDSLLFKKMQLFTDTSIVPAKFISKTSPLSLSLNCPDINFILLALVILSASTVLSILKLFKIILKNLPDVIGVEVLNPYESLPYTYNPSIVKLEESISLKENSILEF